MHPQDDILTLVAHAEIDGCPLDERELDNTFAIIVVAGNETTRQAMALGMLALMRVPRPARSCCARTTSTGRAPSTS